MKTKNDTLNAIQTMVDSAVEQAGYDKTRNAVIIARNSNNTYNIKMDGIEYDNVVLYGSGVLQTNEIVKVVIPNNQASQMYILGKGVIEGRQQGSVNGLNSNAFGRETIASGGNSFAEGYNTTASGNGSHAEGENTTASGFCSHAEGGTTTAKGQYQHAQGKYNVANTSHADIVGNGTPITPSNAYALDWNGNGYYKGDVYVGCNADSTGGNKVLTTADVSTDFLEVYGSQTSGITRTLSATDSWFAVHTPSNWSYRSINGVHTAPNWASVPDPEESYGAITIAKSGFYKIEYQVYFYNNFTAGDNLVSGILLDYTSQDSPGNANSRVSRGKAHASGAYITVGGYCIVECQSGQNLRLGANNTTSGRGTISLSAISRMLITKM